MTRKIEEMLLEKQLDILPDGTLVVDDQSRIIYLNNLFIELWKISGDVLKEGDGLKVLRHGLELIKNGQEMAVEMENIRKNKFEKSRHEIELLDGRFFDVNSSPIVESDQCHGRIWFFRDVTKQKVIENELLKKNQELLKLNAEKDKFFSIIAHDLRNPFNSLLGLSKLLKDDVGSLPINELIQIAGALHQSATNLFQLLENLLEWSRAKMGSRQAFLQPLNLSELANNIIDLYHEMYKKKGIVVVNSIPGNSLISYDSQMIETILRNLIVNAIKFSSKGDRITISANKISESVIEISVEDTGIGMSEEIVGGLFRIDLNEEIRRQGTDNEPSTGLGLLLCKEFVELNGGTIRVKSKKGIGSTFYFTVPIKAD